MYLCVCAPQFCFSEQSSPLSGLRCAGGELSSSLSHSLGFLCVPLCLSLAVFLPFLSLGVPVSFSTFGAAQGGRATRTLEFFCHEIWLS